MKRMGKRMIWSWFGHFALQVAKGVCLIYTCPLSEGFGSADRRAKLTPGVWRIMMIFVVASLIAPITVLADDQPTANLAVAFTTTPEQVTTDDETFTLTVTVTNEGSEAEGVYVIWAECIALCGVEYCDDLGAVSGDLVSWNPGESKSFDLEMDGVPIPTEITYWIVALTADKWPSFELAKDREKYSIGEAIVTVTAGPSYVPLPDLEVTNVVLPTESIEPIDNTFGIQFEIVNSTFEGAQASSSSVVIRAQIEPPGGTGYEPWETWQEFHKEIPALEPGESYSVWQSFTVPKPSEMHWWYYSGSYTGRIRIVIIVDDEDEVPERSEENNVSYGSIDVTPGDEPDLQVTFTTSPEHVTTDDETFILTVTVTNEGAASDGVGLYLKVCRMFSGDEEWSCTYCGHDLHQDIPDWEPGESKSFEFEMESTPYPKDIRYVVVESGTSEVIAETIVSVVAGPSYTALPDLTVWNVKQPYTLVKGTAEFTIEFEVVNRTVEGVSSPASEVLVQTLVYSPKAQDPAVDGAESEIWVERYVDIPSLAPGEREAVSVTCPVPKTSQVVWWISGDDAWSYIDFNIKVDPNNEITERWEEEISNEHFGRISLYPGDEPDLQVNFTTDPEQVATDDETFTLTLTVTNEGAAIDDQVLLLIQCADDGEDETTECSSQAVWGGEDPLSWQPGESKQFEIELSGSDVPALLEYEVLAVPQAHIAQLAWEDRAQYHIGEVVVFVAVSSPVTSQNIPMMSREDPEILQLTATMQADLPSYIFEGPFDVRDSEVSSWKGCRAEKMFFELWIDDVAVPLQLLEFTGFCSAGPIGAYYVDLYCSQCPECTRHHCMWIVEFPANYFTLGTHELRGKWSWWENTGLGGTVLGYREYIRYVALEVE